MLNWCHTCSRLAARWHQKLSFHPNRTQKPGHGTGSRGRRDSVSSYLVQGLQGLQNNGVWAKSQLQISCAATSKLTPGWSMTVVMFAPPDCPTRGKQERGSVEGHGSPKSQAARDHPWGPPLIIDINSKIHRLAVWWVTCAHVNEKIWCSCDLFTIIATSVQTCCIAN